LVAAFLTSTLLTATAGTEALSTDVTVSTDAEDGSSEGIWIPKDATNLNSKAS
jgi:hypothetical protein